jgi:transcriptional regulator with XRE-family HTH domain
MAKKRYDGVSQMVREMEEKDFAEAFDKRLEERDMMKRLLLCRIRNGMSQEEVADKMGCSQSKVSKLEASKDGDLQVGDLVKYAVAIGLHPQFAFFSEVGTASMVKHHFFETKALLEQLVKMAQGDPVIGKGVAGFFTEAFVNYLDMLAKSAKSLPNDAKSDFPLIRVICESDGDCGHGEADESDEPEVRECGHTAVAI